MNSTAQLYEYLQELVDILREEVQVTIEENGANVCGHCIANSFFEENQTRIMSEIYQLTKDEPVEAMQALLRFSVFNKAVTALTENIGIATFELNEEELFAANKN